MRLSLPFTLLPVAAVLAALAAIVTEARAAPNVRPAEPTLHVRELRAVADHYRTLTWAYDRAARRHLVPTSYSYRRSLDGAYLQWTVDAWQRHAYRARTDVLRSLRRRLGVSLPLDPGLHAALSRRVRYMRKLTLTLRGVYPGRSLVRTVASARAVAAKPTEPAMLHAWELRAARAAVAVSRHATRMMLVGPHWLTAAFLCIHRYEAGWSANTGNGYYGGLQMDRPFMARYGGDFVRRFGTADHWPAWAQVEAGVRAYQSGRGFWPWPNTARICGLL